MSNKFREFIQKVGSGSHTSENLTRAEAATATKMMLLGEATPVQIGAFLIAHRIKRPTGEELAGMLDTYDELGPKLQTIGKSVIVLGIPYDGRTRTAPINVITALLLAATEKAVIMHGGGASGERSYRLPTKYGLPLIEIWQGLGIDWTNLTLAQTQQVFESTGIGFVYTPRHFPLNQVLWEYRDQLGKRPPLATMELIWCPYVGDAHIIAGFVHPPTEGMFQEALKLKCVSKYTFIKGLEGSCDLPRDRTAIIGLSSSDSATLTRLQLAPREYGVIPKNVPLSTTEQLIQDIQAVLTGKPGELMQTALWNGGFYLWRSGICPDIPTAMDRAAELITTGVVAAKLQQIKIFIDSIH
ncbi:MAG: anthranilate phosphoribosyltransferase family protein [Cuspidothrix sp.]